MSEFVDLLDWRRRVAEQYAAWRSAAADDPAAASGAFREARERLFREHPQSPVPAGERTAFRLAWWPYDPAYRISAVLEVEAEAGGPHDEPGAGVLELPSSGAGGPRFRRIGRLALSGPLGARSLAAYWIEGYAGGLFLPFRDGTSGSETYGAGRYLLDTIKGADQGADDATGALLLDFNLAFHPSCAYDPRWVCPLAPPENRLDLPVPAGERLR